MIPELEERIWYNYVGWDHVGVTDLLQNIVLDS